MEERGLRMLSTNHICGEGYWVWLIPLATGYISIGIVADPRFHPWEQINTLEGALEWIKDHEPQLADSLEGRLDQIEDFLKVEHFSHGTKKSMDGGQRWTWWARRARSSTRSTRRARTTSRWRTSSRRTWSGASWTARTSQSARRRTTTST